MPDGGGERQQALGDPRGHAGQAAFAVWFQVEGEERGKEFIMWVTSDGKLIRKQGG